jgi:hypothetical protein
LGHLGQKGQKEMRSEQDAKMKKLLDAHKNALFALGKIKRKNEVYDYENDENQQKRENYGDRD